LIAGRAARTSGRAPRGRPRRRSPGTLALAPPLARASFTSAACPRSALVLAPGGGHFRMLRSRGWLDVSLPRSGDCRAELGRGLREQRGRGIPLWPRSRRSLRAESAGGPEEAIRRRSSATSGGVMPENHCHRSVHIGSESRTTTVEGACAIASTVRSIPLTAAPP
jgi:hypothetical protein